MISPMLLVTTSSELETCWCESLWQRACPFGQWFMHHGPSSTVRMQQPQPSVQEKESLWPSMNQPPQDKGFCPFPSWTVPFTFLCLASSLSFAFALSRKPQLQSQYFGHITALHSTSPCVSSCRAWCVVNIFRLHSCSGHWKRERDADLTLSMLALHIS